MAPNLGPVTIGAQTNCTASVTATPAAQVAPKASTPLGVSVTPTAGGPFSCTVQIASNDSNEPLYSIAITGDAPKPCVYANGSMVIGGKKIYRIPVNVGCSGDQVCAAAGLTCAGVPVLSPPSAACVAFHPGTQVKSDINGWRQSVYCGGTAAGLACNSEVQCRDCPLCNATGLACNDPNSSLLSELYVECK